MCTTRASTLVAHQDGRNRSCTQHAYTYTNEHIKPHGKHQQPCDDRRSISENNQTKVNPPRVSVNGAPTAVGSVSAPGDVIQVSAGDVRASSNNCTVTDGDTTAPNDCAPAASDDISSFKRLPVFACIMSRTFAREHSASEAIASSRLSLLYLGIRMVMSASFCTRRPDTRS